MSPSSSFVEPQVQMVWGRYGKHLEIQLPGAHHHRTITALHLRRRTGGHGDMSLGQLSWHKYLWAISQGLETWSGFDRCINSTCRHGVYRRQFDRQWLQLHQNANGDETQTQSRFRINRGLGSSQRNSLSPIGTSFTTISTPWWSPQHPRPLQSLDSHLAAMLINNMAARLIYWEANPKNTILPIRMKCRVDLQ